ncbi:MAG: YbjN domain-containing protein [Spongiibacteraceae bacterium]|jgi:hypothetical protein|nr:YbjN domain-containing protein [Spongiibacteraceae bacterium]
MVDRNELNREQLEQWLDESGLSHYVCDQCHGLHLPRLQELEGVTDSRLFVEPWGLLLSTEIVVRPTAILPLATDLTRLNIDYPVLKLFLDIVDDAMPQLVSGASLLTGAGLTGAQFIHFLTTSIEATRQLVAEMTHLDYILPDENTPQGPRESRVH